MKFTILIPHYKTGKMSAYTISQLLKYKGRHELDIVVIDNNAGDGSTKYLEPFLEHITIIDYPKDKLQSHAIAFDYVLPLVKTSYFLTIENDSFPTQDNWLDFYENLIYDDVDAAVSLLKLSGGEYGHPCGGLYKKSVWEEAKKYCNQIEYSYFPNMGNKESFDCHMMIHNSILDKVLDNPDDWFELAEGYKGLSKDQKLERRDYYKPVVNPFHNGMGRKNESVRTYGERCGNYDAPFILLSGKEKIIFRCGYEPGEWLYFWMLATNKNVFVIPTKTVWMKDREGQQQEYTINKAGFKHLWGISSYTERGSKDVEDIYEAKRNLPEELYNSLPEHQKIK